MVISVVHGVESAVGMLGIRMLGPLTLERAGTCIEFPRSRKVRALLAFLALTQHDVTRSRLCELLWDVPSDPRGELRWCLTKIRNLVDEAGRRRVVTGADTVRLDLSDCFVDVHEVANATQRLDTLTVDQLQQAADLFCGDFLEGLQLESSPAFGGWLEAQRRRFRDAHVLILERLAKSGSSGERHRYLDKWLELAPYDMRAHASLFEMLAQRDRLREGEEHLVATEQLFQSQDLDFAAVREAWRSARAAIDGKTESIQARRASVAVMPFADLSAVSDERGGIADGLAHDITTRLAKLRALFVIAQGTTFALHERGISAFAAAQLLKVDYVVSGSVRRAEDGFVISVELADAQTAHVLWAEIFHGVADDAFHILEEMGNSIVASIAGEIETTERNRAILRPPNTLDAWEAHHRGLWHAYRFNKGDNDRAQQFFETAIRLDPTFARAYAGLSFTHFQNAFQGWTKREDAIDSAYESAGKSILTDDRDPAAHLAMGRAMWLIGHFEDAVMELERTIELSPSFALGHYSLSFAHSQLGDPLAAIASSDHSRRLSPFDPLLFGMFGARAMALVRLSRFEEAADYGIRAAGRPNAHAHILAIAALSLSLAGRIEEARSYVASIRKTLPHYRVDDFLTAMRFAPDDARVFRIAAERIGMT